MIKNLIRDFRLGHHRQGFLTFPGDERHNICIDIKTRAGTRHIVGDDHIQIFAHQLILSMRNHIIGFRCKTDKYLTFPLFTSERRSHIGIFNQRKVTGSPLCCLIFCGAISFAR